MEDAKKIILITPTYPRRPRLNYLKRCIRSFSQDKNLFWIVVEDGPTVDKTVEKLLVLSGIAHIYLNIGPTRNWGNLQRNLALTYIRDHMLKGVVYLADDDNYYDPQIFREIRKTKRVSVFPVGHLGPWNIERPVVRQGKIVGWNAYWSRRKFPVDMAAFAFDAELLQGIKGVIFEVKEECCRQEGRGGESEILEKIINSPDDLEILCDECRKCYVWHNQPLYEPVKLTYCRRMVWISLRNFMAGVKHLLKNFLMFWKE